MRGASLIAAGAGAGRSLSFAYERWFGCEAYSDFEDSSVGDKIGSFSSYTI